MICVSVKRLFRIRLLLQGWADSTLKRRRFRGAGHYPWDFQPLQQASERYMRNHMDLNVLEESKRFPRGE